LAGEYFFADLLEGLAGKCNFSSREIKVRGNFQGYDIPQITK